MDKHKEKAITEAILFAMGDAVSAEKLSVTLECSKEHALEIARELILDYAKEEHGLSVIEVDGSFQMCAKNDTYEYLSKIIKLPKDYKMTDIQLETLSIIAYKQPITKAEIEKIRGVKSDHAVNRLVEVGLVEEKSRLNTPGRPLAFGTTDEFLKRFGLVNVDELPDMNAEKAEEIKQEAEEEVGYVVSPAEEKNG